MALTDFPRLPRPGQYQTRAQRLNRLDMLTSAEVRRLQARFRQEATQQAQGLGRADALRFAPPRGTPSVTPTPPFGARPLPLPPEFVSPEQAARIRAAPGITSGLLEPVGRFSKRFLEPTQALGGQALEATLKTPGLFLGQGIREVEQRLGGRQAPPPPELPSIVRRGPVNPVTAAFGNDEEIARAQTVLQEDLSLPESMAAQIIFDPLNLVPGIGFTKTKQFGQLLRTATQATGPARIRALTALRESEVLKGAAKAVRSEVGGVAPELVARRAELLTENRALKTLVQEGRATPQQEARLTQVRNEIADLGTEGGGGRVGRQRLLDERLQLIRKREAGIASVSDAGRLGSVEDELIRRGWLEAPVVEPSEGLVSGVEVVTPRGRGTIRGSGVRGGQRLYAVALEQVPMGRSGNVAEFPADELRIVGTEGGGRAPRRPAPEGPRRFTASGVNIEPPALRPLPSERAAVPPAG